MTTGSELIVGPGGKIYHLGLTAEQLADNVILCGDPARAAKIAAFFDDGSIVGRADNREFSSVTGRYHGLPITVIGTGIGPDNTEIALVEIYALNEFNRELRTENKPARPLTIIRVGTCGTPQIDIDPGTLAVSELALGLDSAALFYDSPESRLGETARRLEAAAWRLLEESTPLNARFKGRIFPYVAQPSPEVTRALQEKARGEWASGVTVTCPGFFAPQGRKISGLNLTVPDLWERLAELEVDGRRVINLEMETSLLFHLAGIMNYRAGSVCTVIANRAGGSFLADYQPAVERAALTALDALVALNDY